MATLSIIQRIKGNTKPIGDTRRAVDSLGKSGRSTNSILKRLQSNISGAMAKAARFAAAGLLGLGAAFGVAAGKGFSFNNSMEQVEAKLFAFLKDGQAVSSTLDMISDRASRTPFAFEDMANATAALIPAAKQSGKEVEELIALAEILAASNPAEGLQGAAFSLKEALGGDFVSIVERFNLPRQRLRELKEQGVPALEAVRIAMQELGLDADLVTGLSQTAAGRLSTVKDQLLGIASRLTQPIFERVSAGLGKVVQFFDNNGEAINKFVDRLSGNINFVVDRITILWKALASGKNPSQAIKTFLTTIGMRFGLTGDEASQLADKIGTVFSAVMEIIAKFFATGEGFLDWYDTLDSVRELLFSFGLSSGTVDAITNGIFILSDAFWKLRENVQIRDVLIALAAVITAIVLPSLIAMVLPILGIIAVFALVLAAVVVLRKVWETNFGGIQEFTAGIWSAIQQGFAAFSALFQGDFDGFKEQIKAAWETGWNAIVTFLGNLWGMVQPKLEEWYTAFVDWVNNADWEAIAQTVTETIIDGLGKFIGAVAGTLAAWYQTVDEWVQNADWKAIGNAIVDFIVNFATGQWLLIIGEKVKEWYDSTKGATDGIAWGDIGDAIIRGIANGLSNAKGILADAARSAAKSAFEAAKSFLGISSPSTLFQDGIGFNIGLGYIPDFSKIRPKFEKAMSGFVASLPAPRVDTAVTAAAFTPQVAFAGSAPQAAGDVIFNINITGPVYGMKDLEERLKEAAERLLNEVGISARSRIRLNG